MILMSDCGCEALHGMGAYTSLLSLPLQRVWEFLLLVPLVFYSPGGFPLQCIPPNGKSDGWMEVLPNSGVGNWASSTPHRKSLVPGWVTLVLGEDKRMWYKPTGLLRGAILQKMFLPAKSDIRGKVTSKDIVTHWQFLHICILIKYFA